MSYQQTYLNRKLAGTCVKCGIRDPIEGSTTCDPCLEEDQEADAKRANGFRKAGLCRCGRPRHNDGRKLLKSCRNCNIAQRMRWILRYRQGSEQSSAVRLVMLARDIGKTLHMLRLMNPKFENLELQAQLLDSKKIYLDEAERLVPGIVEDLTPDEIAPARLK